MLTVPRYLHDLPLAPTRSWSTSEPPLLPAAAQPALKRSLESPSAEVRWRAALELARQHALPVDHLFSDDVAVAEIALSTLHRLERGARIDRVRRAATTHEHPRVRLRALRMLKDPSVGLEDEDSAVRAAAIVYCRDDALSRAALASDDLCVRLAGMEFLDDDDARQDIDAALALLPRAARFELVMRASYAAPRASFAPLFRFLKSQRRQDVARAMLRIHLLERFPKIPSNAPYAEQLLGRFLRTPRLTFRNSAARVPQLLSTTDEKVSTFERNLPLRLVLAHPTLFLFEERVTILRQFRPEREVRAELDALRASISPFVYRAVARGLRGPGSDYLN